MVKQVKAEIDPQGNVKLDWQGFQGSNCLSESKRLHELLALRFGLVAVKETEFVAKPELQQAQAQEAQAQRQAEEVQYGE
jgi:hypothetical protein